MVLLASVGRFIWNDTLRFAAQTDCSVVDEIKVISWFLSRAFTKTKLKQQRKEVGAKQKIVGCGIKVFTQRLPQIKGFIAPGL